jgi:hypothetical protein
MFAGNWDESWSAVWLDTGAGQPLPADHPLYARRLEVDGLVLANLLRLNQDRAAEGAVVVPASNRTGSNSGPGIDPEFESTRR